MMMKLSTARVSLWALAVVLASVLALAADLQAQMVGGSRSPSTAVILSTDQQQTELHALTDVQRQSGTQIDSREVNAYKEFYKVADSDKRIKLGQDFLQKYPHSLLTEAVEARLVTAYYDRQDWKEFYATADIALALKPDDIDVLTTVGWVIPHFFNPHDPDADQRLDKAETYEKHAIQVMGTMPKPDYLSDAQFASLKSQKSVQAHSALGLVYFRRNDFDASEKELSLATQNNPNADPADLFVLGVDLENTNQNSEAADAYARCAQFAGSLQDRCKQSADALKKRAGTAK